MAEKTEYRPFTTDEGYIIDVPKYMPDSEVRKHLGTDANKAVIKGFEAAPTEATGDRTAGKVAPVVPSGQVAPGFWREAGIGGGQLARGVASPVALPGDVYSAARAVSGNLLPEQHRLITSPDLDQIFTNQLGITPSSLTPTGRLERDFAGAMRGTGEALTPLAVSRPLGVAARAANYPRVANALGGGSIPLNIVSGAGSGVGTEEAARFQREQGTMPADSGGLAPLVAPAAGMVIGGTLGTGYDLGRMGVQAVTGRTPFTTAAGRLPGINLAMGEPYPRTVAEDLQTMVRAMGQPASGLTVEQYNSIAGPRVSRDSAYAAAIGDPATAQALRANFPDQMDGIAASHVANAQTRGAWNSLHPRVRESLIPDPGDRTAIDQAFRGGTVPSGRFLENESFTDRLSAIKERMAVGGILGYDIGHGLVEAVHADPSIAGAAAILGAAIPYGRRFLNWSLTSPTGRQATIGGAIGVPQGASVLQPGGMQYTAPPDFLPPDAR
jgi:hypothetical protein